MALMENKSILSRLKCHTRRPDFPEAKDSNLVSNLTLVAFRFLVKKLLHNKYFYDLQLIFFDTI